MTDYAYNGWPVVRDTSKLAELKVRTESLGRVLAGDVFDVLSYVAHQLDARVEPVDLGHSRDDWGWVVKPNSNNKSQWSVHAAGGAFDYNAVRHPNGRRDTWTNEQEAEIRQILAEVDNVVRCLFGYDEMHFEICENADKVAKVAARIRAAKGPTIKPTPAPAKPVLKQGSTGDAVKVLQAHMRRVYPAYARTLRVDGVFGPATHKVVVEFQRRSELVQDGIVGPKTWKALGL